MTPRAKRPRYVWLVVYDAVTEGSIGGEWFTSAKTAREEARQYGVSYVRARLDPVMPRKTRPAKK